MHMTPTKTSRLFLVILRIVVGWFLLYQGITAFLDPAWSLFSFIENAQTFPEFYNAVADPALEPFLTIAVKVLYIVIGGALITGLFVRSAALLGAALMIFLYFPRLSFPYVNEVNYIVDEHLLIAFVLLYLFTARAGEVFSLKRLFRRSHE
jgi:thiosulfate dehydrogenase (quinone) large subunit